MNLKLYLKFDNKITNIDENENGRIILGKRVYPTIKRTTGLPQHLNTTLDFILFEADGFLANHEGIEIMLRAF